ncbi:penicillin acylase family protein, partial [Desulfamplus magnetovallimortis]|uniref:penicillin acylase family protein n=1 Tax=Desulfamplus magnetovallimortis TaxID=1246637 RepID=UPI00111A0FCF
MQKRQNRSLWMAGILFLLAVATASADTCITMTNDMTLTISCASYGETEFEFSLLPYQNQDAETPFDFFWQLQSGSFLVHDSNSDCQEPVAVYSDLTFIIPCVKYYGTHMTFGLKPVSHESGLLWKLDADSLELLDLPVTTTRDEKGVWFIEGDAKADLYTVFEAMGYAVASDRLWQAEKYRRVGRGKLAEIFGSSQLESDIKVRTTGYSDDEYKQGFDALDQESKEIINGYVAGFNRRITEVIADRSKMPFEFLALGASLGIDFVPEPWTPTDILAWATNMLRFFDGEATERGQIDNLALFQDLATRFPEDYLAMFEDMRWRDDPDSVTYIDKNDIDIGNNDIDNDDIDNDDNNDINNDDNNDINNDDNNDINNDDNNEVAGKNIVIDQDSFDFTCDFMELADEMEQNDENIVANLKEINAYVKMGSYAWVVAGDKTASGNPIVYSGPQMDHAFDFSVPSIVTEGSIKAGGLNISGMTIAGMPAIVIGRTPNHAWSMQVGHAHTLDYYLEDSSAVALHRIETIKVAGEDDVELPVYRTSHGPVINSDPFISWKYSHWGKEFEIIKTYLDLAKAQSMDDFGNAIDRVSLSQHYCYADNQGNIAYWMSGMDPVRPEGIDPRFPQPGDGTAEWAEPVTYKTLSHDRNALRGFYSGWNSRSSHDYANSPNTPSYYFGPFHRGHILEDYLSTNDELTFEDIRDLALYIATTDSIRNEYLLSEHDTYGDGGNPWKYVKDDFTAAVQSAPTYSRSSALELLNGWDGHFVEGGKDSWADGEDRADAWILMNQWI